MTTAYVPPSDFLKSLIDEDGPLTEPDVRRLIDLMQDTDDANRDWATLLLAQQEIDTAEVRQALVRAASDENEYVRGEAILGLSSLDKTVALPLLKNELSGQFASLQLFEAAILIADPSLAEYLEAFTDPSEDELLDKLVLEALLVCEKKAD